MLNSVYRIKIFLRKKMGALKIDEILVMLLKSTEIFFMVFIRMTGIFVVAPIFGRRNIPAYYKIGFAFFLTIISLNSIKISDMDKFKTLIEFSVVASLELLIGIIIGYIAYLILSAIYLAGQLIDMQIGFGIVNVLDPMSNMQIPITANFYMIITTLMFISLDGHHSMIRAIFKSYHYIPVGAIKFNKIILSDFLNIFSVTFSLAFRIAAPITAAIILTDVALGIMSKTMPQLNVFVLGMPIKIIIGLAILVLTMSVYIIVIKNMMELIDESTIKIMKDLGLIRW